MPARSRERSSARPAPTREGADFRVLCRKLEAALAGIRRVENVSKMLESIVQNLLEDFEDELGFEGGRVYRRERDDYVLCCGLGTSRNVPIGLRVPHDYPPHLRTLADGIVVMSRGEAGFDPAFEKVIGVRETFAAVAVGEGNSHVIAFSIKGRPKEEQLYYSLTAVRHAVSLKLQQQQVTGMLEEARAIQESILPNAPPPFTGFDIHARTRPAEMVGGDLYDFFPLSGSALGIAIVDSSGHGLPAALLARDVITGLRMRTGGLHKIAPTIERLNKVIHRAALSSKFASLFYGELHRGGALAYCNAGHNPPLLRRGRSFIELAEGGAVLGPLPQAHYRSGRVQMRRGDTVILFTDGIVERVSRDGKLFGPDRLRRLLLDLNGAGAREMTEAILEAADRHGRGAAVGDDMTVLVARRL